MNIFHFINDDWILTIVRVILGTVMVYYGWPKIKDLKSNGDDFIKMGFKPGIFWGTAVALVEFVGGIFMILGLFSEVIAVLFGIQMAVGAIWKVTKTDKPFSDWSYDLQLFAMCLVIIAFGPGLYAFNSII